MKPEPRGFMTAALSLAARTIGDTWPNPSVGCILVKDDVVIGRGWTASGGRPHAEAEALKRAGAAAPGATAYVTLEPCSHHGKTPPCADALVAAGIARAVVATGDPDPRVSGRGLERLRAAGIAVEEGLCRAEADRLNAGFLLRVREQRPLFALKTASTLDGRIALASGESRWITGAAAREAVQTVRAQFDAILVGSGTALADDPMLTCRLPGYTGRPKVRIVLDRRLRLVPTSKLAKTAAEVPTWVITATDGARAEALRAAGVEIIAVEGAADDRGFAHQVAEALGTRGLTRVLIEGGGAVAAAFLGADLIDELMWFRSGGIIGGDGRPAIGALGAQDLGAIPRFKRQSSLTFGADTAEFWVR
jgi:diaminohydroxyphosphoribosylaminopyrimidine deaminase/5-amino-6-(5-phosphoribosylamino)uracil reductase